MEKYICDQLCPILGLEVSEEVAKYIMSIDNPNDLEDYLNSLIDLTDQTSRNLCKNITKAKFESQQPKTKQNKNNNANKSNSNLAGNKQKPSNANNTENDKRKPSLHNNNLNNSKITKTLSTMTLDSTGSTFSDGSGKKKQKFKKFQLGEIYNGYLRDGRIPCECQARRHNLINNCLNCGRIVCEQEGSGPCFFCDYMVGTPGEMEILQSTGSSEADSLYRSLISRKQSNAWKKAIDSRDRLLKFDQNKAPQTRIIDDELDWYDVNNRWSTPQEREEAAKRLKRDMERKYPSRLGARKITLDLLGRKVQEDVFYNDEIEPEIEEKSPGTMRKYSPTVPDNKTVLESIKKEKEAKKRLSEEFRVAEEEAVDDDEFLDEFGTYEPVPVPSDLLPPKRINKDSADALYVEDADAIPNSFDYITGLSKLPTDKVMYNSSKDQKMLKSYDTRMCLSMHQPWASLLVYGVKKHEGRVWSSKHRGYLWIAATAKQVEKEEIEKMETFYKHYYDDHDIKFPKEYPNGVLLGRVFVEECLSQEDYREKYPNGESESPFVFICKDFKKLQVPIPVKGSYKIWELPVNVHRLAKEAMGIIERFHR